MWLLVADVQAPQLTSEGNSSHIMTMAIAADRGVVLFFILPFQVLKPVVARHCHSQGECHFLYDLLHKIHGHPSHWGAAGHTPIPYGLSTAPPGLARGSAGSCNGVR